MTKTHKCVCDLHRFWLLGTLRANVIASNQPSSMAMADVTCRVPDKMSVYGISTVRVTPASSATMAPAEAIQPMPKPCG